MEKSRPRTYLEEPEAPPSPPARARTNVALTWVGSLRRHRRTSDQRERACGDGGPGVPVPASACGRRQAWWRSLQVRASDAASLALRAGGHHHCFPRGSKIAKVMVQIGQKDDI